MMDKYQFAIEEIGLSGAVSLGKCSESTLRRWGRKFNQRLAWEKCEWRVKTFRDGNIITRVNPKTGENYLAEAE